MPHRVHPGPDHVQPTVGEAMPDLRQSEPETNELTPRDPKMLPPRERPRSRLYIFGRHSNTKCSGGWVRPHASWVRPGIERSAIDTGAASGIGRAIAERLTDEGVRVLAVDLEPAADRPGEPFAADRTTREGNRAAVDAARERFGRLDAVIATM